MLIVVYILDLGSPKYIKRLVKATVGIQAALYIALGSLWLALGSSQKPGTRFGMGNSRGTDKGTNHQEGPWNPQRGGSGIFSLLARHPPYRSATLATPPYPFSSPPSSPETPAGKSLVIMDP